MKKRLGKVKLPIMTFQGVANEEASNYESRVSTSYLSTIFSNVFPYGVNSRISWDIEYTAVSPHFDLVDENEENLPFYYIGLDENWQFVCSRKPLTYINNAFHLAGCIVARCFETGKYEDLFPP